MTTVSAPYNLDRNLLSLEQAEEMVKAATFAIALAPLGRKEKADWWGTGFFCSESGLALTALHNFQDCPAQQYFDAFYQGQWITLEWIEEWSSELADITVLRLYEKPADLNIQSIPAGYLDPSLSLPARKLFWSGREVIIYGFPIRGWGQGSWRIEGAIDSATPLAEIRESNEVVPRLQIHGSRIKALEGISGSAIFDRHLRCVIGVEGSYDGESLVFGSELAHLVAEHPALASHFQSLLDPQQKLEKCVGVLARRKDDTIPQFIPINVLLCPGANVSAEVTFAHEALQEQARLALGLAGEYVRKSKGKLRELFEERYWVADKPYSCALFHLPKGDWDSLPAIRVGMALAYLAKVLSDILRFDLDLPVAFPQSLFLTAAGGDEAGLTGEPLLADALERLQPLPPTLLLYAREQQPELQRILDLPSGVRCLPVDQRDDILESFFFEFVEETKPAVELRISQALKDDLAALLEQEEKLRRAEAAARGQQARQQEVAVEAELARAEVEYLHAKYNEIYKRLLDRKEIPPLSQVLEEYTCWREEKRAEQEPEQKRTDEDALPHIVLIPDVGFIAAQVTEKEVCTRLYRRLAALCHPDTQPAEATQFTHLVEHRHDRVWLEALEGALATWGTDINQPKATDTVSAFLARLFFLRETQEKLRQRISTLSAQVGSYSGAGLTEGLETQEKWLQTLKYDIDFAWRRLNHFLGQEPIRPGS